MQTINLLILSPSNEGTIAKCTASLYNSLKRYENINVKCLCLYKYANGEDSLNDCEFLIDRTIDLNVNQSFLSKIKWANNYKKLFKPHITISTLYVTNIINVLSCGNEKKIGVFHSPHLQARAQGILYYFINCLVYWIVYPFLDKCFCVSKEVARDLLHFRTINRKKIEVVYNIHDSDLIRSLADELLSEDEERIFNKKVIIYCGRLDENKAPDRAINAFVNLADEKVHLVLIGPDPNGMWPRLWTSIPETHRSKVHYLGNQNNPYRFIKRSNMLISSSYSEGLPGVLIEALCLGVPVVTTNSSRGNWEILSCDRDYNKNLRGIKEVRDGVITSNMSCVDREQYNEDIVNLTKGMTLILERQTKVEFKFSENIMAENIVDKYLEIMN